MQRLLEAGARHGGHMCGAVIPRRPPASRGGAREPARPRRRRGARGARWRTEVGRSDGRRSEVGGRKRGRPMDGNTFYLSAYSL